MESRSSPRPLAAVLPCPAGLAPLSGLALQVHGTDYHHEPLLSRFLLVDTWRQRFTAKIQNLTKYISLISSQNIS